MKHLRKWVVLAGLMIAMAVTTGIDTSDSRLVAVITVTNSTGEDQGVVPQVVAVPLSTQDLLDGGFTSGLNLEIHDSAGNDVPFMPAWERSTGVTACFNDDGGIYANETADCNDLGADDFFYWAASPAVADAFAVVAEHEFRKLWFDISTPGGMSGGDLWTVVWEYCVVPSACAAATSTDWVILANVQDNTAGLSKAGLNSVSWDTPTDPPMSLTDVDSVDGYAVRARMTDLGTGDYTQPLGQAVQFETAQWMILVDGLNAGDSKNFFLHVDTGSNSRVFHRFFGGPESYSINDSADLEGGADFEVEIKGAFTTNIVGDSTQQKIIHKGSSSFSLAAGNTEIVTTVGGTTLTATGFADNVERTIRINNHPTNGFRLFVDEVLEASAAGVTMSDVGNRWEMTRGHIAPGVNNGGVFYYDFVKITVNGDLKVHYQTNESVKSDDDVPNRACACKTGVFVSTLPGGFPDYQSGMLKPNFTVVVSALQPFADIGPSLGAAAGSDVVNDIDGSAEGTAFAAASAPSSNLPGFEFLNAMATKDYDPTQGGTQGIPISFFYIVIAGAILIMAMAGVMIVSKSLLYAVIAGGVIATLFVSVTIISPWFLMWFAIPAVLLFLVKGPISL